MGIIYQNRNETFTIRLTHNNNYPPHLHRQVELFYVIDGSITITIGTKQMELTKGMMSLAFPDTVHKTVTPESSLALMIIFPPDLLPDFYHDFINMNLENPFFTDCEKLQEITDDIEKLLEYTQPKVSMTNSMYSDVTSNTNTDIINDTTADILIIKGYLYLIFGRLFKMCNLQPQILTKMDICQKVARYLNTHFTEPIGLTELSDALGYSSFHISHIFKENFGCSLSDYLNRMRAEHAMGLLTSSDMSITEICFASGFHSLRTFYRVFEKVYGKTPGEAKI